MPKCDANPAVEAKKANRGLTIIGPAVIVAAAGIGASDIIAASVAGARFGLALIWAIVVGAVLKAILAECIGRWQLASGTTVLQGVSTHLPRWVLFVFFGYLIVWSIGVAAALSNGCGLAIANLTDGRVSASWGAVVHVVIAALIVGSGTLKHFTKAMKGLIVVMFLAVVFCASHYVGTPQSLSEWRFPQIPTGAGPYVLSVIGGIGGSMTLLAYNYLPGSHRSDNALRHMHGDIVLAYAFTAVFGVSIMVIASQAFKAAGPFSFSQHLIPNMTDLIRQNLGPVGVWSFAIGFWAAVVASLLGTWQTIPLLIAECYSLVRPLPEADHAVIIKGGSPVYNSALAVLSIAGVLFAFAGQPLAVIVAYTVLASLFVPLIATMLLFLSNCAQPKAPGLRNSWPTNLLLLLIVGLFAILAVYEITRFLF